jgi:lactate dehydrogenase-like 2-hydroxyacid dehydrogenase
LRPHAVLVNIARGDVIDEVALIAALSAGHTPGAGFGVYEHELELPRALKEMQNVTLLLHMDTSTLVTRLDMEVMAVANLTAIADGHGLLIEYLVARGFHTVIAIVTAANPASARSHDACGFELVGTLHEMGRKFDNWHGTRTYQRMIGEDDTAA